MKQCPIQGYLIISVIVSSAPYLVLTPLISTRSQEKGARSRESIRQTVRLAMSSKELSKELLSNVGIFRPELLVIWGHLVFNITNESYPHLSNIISSEHITHEPSFN